MQGALGLIVAVSLSLALAGLPLLVGWWFPRHSCKKWAASAEALGLTLAPYLPEHRVSGFFTKPPSYLQPMRGRRGGFEVECRVRVVSTGRDGRTYATCVRVTLPRSLDLGLSLRPLGLLGRAWTAVVGEGDVQLWEPDLDRAYDIIASDDEGVRALLTAPAVAHALRASGPGPFCFHLDDTAVWLERHGKQLNAEALSKALDAAVELARRLVETRSQMHLHSPAPRG